MGKSKGMGSHQSARMKNDEWLTPPEIIKALGIFDIDPCAPIQRPWETATSHYTLADDGLAQKWEGRVWLNPPYGQHTGKWLKRLADHGTGIALVFARTETEMFFEHIWNRADAVFFFSGRLYFHYANGSRADANAGAPSCLVAYGKSNIEAIRKSGLKGKLICLHPKPLLCDVRELLQMINEIPCNCIEAYKSRGLSDPDCPRCNYVDDDVVEKVRAHFA